MKSVLSVVFAVALMCSAVTAQEAKTTTSKDTAEKCECKSADSKVAMASAKTESKGECSGCDKEGQCPVSIAMAKLPKMTYRVGTTDTCCSESATKMAEEKKETLHYVVGESVFDEKSAAYTSLVEQTEAMVTKFVTPCKCETSGTTTIAGAACKCPVEAGKKTELVSTCLLYTSPSPRDLSTSRMPSSA